MSNLTNILEIMTDKITPLNRPKGELKNILKDDLKRLGLSDKKIESALTWLSNFDHIKYIKAERRYRVRNRHLVKTMDGSLVVSGARSSQMIVDMKDKEPDGVITTTEKLADGLKFDKVTVTEKAAKRLQRFFGPIPQQETSFNIVAGIKSQVNWEDKMLWRREDVSPYISINNSKLRIFSPIFMQFLKTEESLEILNTYKKLFSINLIENKTKTGSIYILVRKKNDYYETVQLPSYNLEESRRAKYYVLQKANVCPFDWNKENETLSLPKMLPLPPELNKALCCASCCPPRDEKKEISGRGIEFEIHKNISEKLMHQIARCIWLEGEI
jgi:hypothetical protein